MNATEQQLDEVVSLAYEAALDPAIADLPYCRLASLLGDVCFVTSVFGPEGLLRTVSTVPDPNAAQILMDRFRGMDTNQILAAMPRIPQATTVVRQSVEDDRGYFRSALYNEVFRYQDLAHQGLACLLRNEDHLAPLGILRPRSAGPLSSEQLALLDRVLPHLRRAVQIGLRAELLEQEAQAERFALDRIPLGVFVLDGRGRVLSSNAKARELLERDDGLKLRSREPAAAQHADQLALAAAIRQTLASPQHGASAVAIHRPPPREPYIAVVAPSTGQLDNPLQASRACLLISDPDARPVSLRRYLRQLFNMSGTEADLACQLLDGHTVQEVADIRAVSPATVRTQIRAVFSKTGLSRQSDLIRLLSRIPGVR